MRNEAALPFHLAARAAQIRPFHVMELLAKARALEAQGRSLVHMEIGEPDFTTPPEIVSAGQHALEKGHTFYTPATGLPALQAAISDWYRQTHGLPIAPERIVVTPGASGALLLTIAAVVNPGEEVLLPDPTYPCNRHFVRLFEGVARNLPVGPDTRYQLTAARVEANWSPRTVAALVASPANPTGTLLSAPELGALIATVHTCGGRLIVDEIYHGLVYGTEAVSALSLSDEVFVINSFSKYFGMTGWRLGWLVAPAAYMPALEKLAQNIFLAASTPSQHAALAAFSPATRLILEERRREFARRRDFLIPALRSLGFDIPGEPQGAFYVYARCDRLTDDSFAFCQRLLEEVGVVVTPGVDFGEHGAAQHVRFAYTTAMDNLEEGVQRLKRFLAI